MKLKQETTESLLKYVMARIYRKVTILQTAENINAYYHYNKIHTARKYIVYMHSKGKT